MLFDKNKYSIVFYDIDKQLDRHERYQGIITPVTFGWGGVAFSLASVL